MMGVMFVRRTSISKPRSGSGPPAALRIQQNEDIRIANEAIIEIADGSSPVKSTPTMELSSIA